MTLFDERLPRALRLDLLGLFDFHVDVNSHLFAALTHRLGAIPWLRDAGPRRRTLDHVFDYILDDQQFPPTCPGREESVYGKLRLTVLATIADVAPGGLLLVNEQEGTEASAATTIARSRLDLMALSAADVALFRGEVKSKAVMHSNADGLLVAMAEAVHKTRWVCPLLPGLPAVPALAVAWPLAQFFALRPSSDDGDVEEARLGPVLDLTRLEHRLALVARSVNAGRFVRDAPPPEAFFGQPALHRPTLTLQNGEIRGRSALVWITKYRAPMAEPMVLNEAEWVALYQPLVGVRVANLVQVLDIFGRPPRIALGPVGWTPATPTPSTAAEAMDAIRAVAAALVGLHALERAHRNVCWRNVIRTATGGWLLVDLDHLAVLQRGSCAWPTTIPPQDQIVTAPSWRSAAEDTTGRRRRWTARHDLWQLARMARTVRALDGRWMRQAFDALCNGRAADVAALGVAPVAATERFGGAT